jgi:hypothetical protein
VIIGDGKNKNSWKEYKDPEIKAYLDGHPPVISIEGIGTISVNKDDKATWGSDVARVLPNNINLSNLNLPDKFQAEDTSKIISPCNNSKEEEIKNTLKAVTDLNKIKNESTVIDDSSKRDSKEFKSLPTVHSAEGSEAVSK